MSGKVINIHDARLKTAAINVRSISISGRQVTLAVFRQLYEEPLISNDGTLAGLPWGIVNYHPDRCEGGKPHHHIVWQKGDELRRATVYVEPVFEAYASATVSAYLAARNRDVICGVLDGAVFRPNGDDSPCLWKRKGISVAATLSPQHRMMIHLHIRPPGLLSLPTDADEADYDARRKAWNEGVRSKGAPNTVHTRTPEHGYPSKPVQHLFADDILEALNANLSAGPSRRSELMHTLDKEIEQEIARRARWKKTTLELTNLPQVFVAV